MLVRIAALVVIAAQTMNSHAQTRSPRPRLSATISFELPNGLRVILQEDRTVPLVSISLLCGVGPADEVPGRSGLAHLFEHVMLGGSLHIPNELRHQVLATIGAADTGGTDNDYTIYYALGPANALETLLWLQSDRLGFVSLDEKRLKNQKAVVHNERKQVVENRPYGMADEEVVSSLFPQPHPYHWNTIGRHDDIERATLDDMKGFFAQHYGPNNATLVIVGDFSVKAARSAVTKYFASLDVAVSPTLARPTHVQAPPTSAIRHSLTDHVELPRISIAWVTPPAFADAHVDFELLEKALGEGRSSLLSRHLVHELGMAHQVSCSYWPYRLGGYFQCDLIAQPGVPLRELEREFDVVLRAVQRNGLAESDLVRARAQQNSQILHDLENLMDRSKLLNRYLFYTGDPRYYNHHFHRVERATSASIRRTAARWLGSHRVVVTVTPSSGRS